MDTFVLARGSDAWLYVHGPKWEYRRDTDDPYTALYIPARVLSLMRPERDLIVLPGNSPAVRDFARFCVSVLGIKREQILYTSGRSYQVQTDARAELLPDLRRLMSKGSWQFVPYAVSPSTERLARALGVGVVGDPPSWTSRFGSKAILHPNAIPHRRPASLPLLDAHCSGVRKARGYLAMDREELDMAMRLLKEDGITDVLLKPVSGSTGEGIVHARTVDGSNGYTLPLGPILVEERLSIDEDCDGNPIAPSIQYVRGEVGVPTDQLMHGFSHCGNHFPAQGDGDRSLEFARMAKCIVNWSKPRGMGGFDALSVGGKPVLVDVNAGRWTGAHPALLFRAQYAPTSYVLSWKVEPNGSVDQLWDKLCSSGIAFLPGKSTHGVFPLCYLSGMWAMLIAIGTSPTQVRELVEHTKAL